MEKKDGELRSIFEVDVVKSVYWGHPNVTDVTVVGPSETSEDRLFQFFNHQEFQGTYPSSTKDLFVSLLDVSIQLNTLLLHLININPQRVF